MNRLIIGILERQTLTNQRVQTALVDDGHLLISTKGALNQCILSVKVSTIPGKCQLIQKSDCQPHQEKSRKLSTEIRKRQLMRYSATVLQFQKGYSKTPKNTSIFIYIYLYI